MPASKVNGLIKYIGTITAVILTIGGLVWNASAQNAKLETNYRDTLALKMVSEVQAQKITTIEVKLDYIIKGIDDIQRQMKKNHEK